MARVLIVEDNPTMAEVIGLIVSHIGHEAVITHGGREALDFIASDPPDLVLLDLLMPDIDGYETLRRMRAMPQGEKMPVIIVTASADVNHERSGLPAGSNACLIKPVDIDVLSEEIAKYIENISG